MSNSQTYIRLPNVWATHCSKWSRAYSSIGYRGSKTLLNTKAGAYLGPPPLEPIRLSNGGDIKNMSSYRTRADTLNVADVTFAQPLLRYVIRFSQLIHHF